MAIDSETVFGRFVEMIEKHFDVNRDDGRSKVLHLHRRTTERESSSLLRRLGIGEGDFGLYAPESSVEWWGVRNSAPSWSPDVTGENLKIVQSTLGTISHFTTLMPSGHYFKKPVVLGHKCMC